MKLTRHWYAADLRQMYAHKTHTECDDGYCLMSRRFSVHHCHCRVIANRNRDERESHLKPHQNEYQTHTRTFRNHVEKSVWMVIFVLFLCQARFFRWFINFFPVAVVVFKIIISYPENFSVLDNPQIRWQIYITKPTFVSHFMWYTSIKIFVFITHNKNISFHSNDLIYQTNIPHSVCFHPISEPNKLYFHIIIHLYLYFLLWGNRSSIFES